LKKETSNSETVPKINVVILQPHKESHFCPSSFQKNQKRRSFGLQPQDDKVSESMLTIALFVILSEAKNLMLLLNFSP